MKLRQPVTLIILASLLLASCAPGNFPVSSNPSAPESMENTQPSPLPVTVPSSEPSPSPELLPSPEPSPSPTPSSDGKGEPLGSREKVEAQVKGDSFAMPPNGTTLTADLNGDGQPETVTFSWLPPKSMPESDDVRTNIEAEIDGSSYALEVEPAAWLIFISCTAADFDGDEAEELLFYFSPAGAGGMGAGIITPVKWGKDGFYCLPVPRDGTESLFHHNGGYGFDAEIALRDDRMVELICAETGYTQLFPVGELGDWDVYDGAGKLTAGYIERANTDDMVTGIDSIFDMKVFRADGRVYILICQYCWAITHAGGIGVLESTFYYENGQYIVSSQTVVPIDEWDYDFD